MMKCRQCAEEFLGRRCPNCGALSDEHIEILSPAGSAKRMPDWVQGTSGTASHKRLQTVLVEDYPALPEDAEVLRASGDALCPICGNALRVHVRYAYPWSENYAVLGCNGIYYHL